MDIWLTKDQNKTIANIYMWLSKPTMRDGMFVSQAPNQCLGSIDYQMATKINLDINRGDCEQYTIKFGKIK